MAHFAKINSENIVVKVHVVNNSELIIEDGEELEINGIRHLERHGTDSGFYWKQTSYNTLAGVHKLGGTPYRKNYAGTGYSYNESRDAFIPPKPYQSWTLDENTCQWIAPKPLPDDGKPYRWDENKKSWKKL
jgi:hypothetical protein